MRLHVERAVLALRLDRLHVLRDLDRQAARRLVIAEHDVEHRRARNAEFDDDRVRLALKLVHDHRVVERRADDHGLIAHRPAAREDVVEVRLVVGGVRLAAVAAVREILAEVAARDADGARGIRRIRAVLQRDRQVAVAAAFGVRLRIRVAGRAFDEHDRDVRLLRRFDARAVRREEFRRDGVLGVRRDVVAHEALRSADLPHRRVDLQPLFQRQAALPVLQQHDGLVLRLEAVVAERFAADNLHGLLGVEVRVLKQAALEDVFQKARGGALHAGAHRVLAEPRAAEPVRLHDRRDLRIAAELVDAVQDRGEAALGLRLVLHIEAPAAERVDVRRGVLRDVPVRADDTPEAVLLAQQVLDEVFAVGIADVFAVLRVEPPGDRVVRHDRRGRARRAVQPEGRLRKRLHVLGGVAGRVDRVFAERVVRVAAALAGAAARPVLDHRVDAVAAPAGLAALRRLHAVAVRLDELLRHLDVFAERVDEAHPARLGAQVDLRAERRRDAERAVFAGGVLGELPDDRGVEAGREADALGPPAHVAAAGFELHAGIAARAVARIGGDVDRDAVRQRLGARLQRVAPPRRGARVLHGDHQDMPDVLPLHEFLLLVGKRIRRLAGRSIRLPAVRAAERAGGLRRHGLMRRIQHEARDLLERQPLREVLRARLVGKPPVLIRQQLAAAFKILEVQAVLLDQLHARRRRPRQCLPVFLRQAADAVLLFYIHSRHLAFCSDSGEILSYFQADVKEFRRFGTVCRQFYFSAQFLLKLFRSLSTCPRCPWISHRPSAASNAPIFLFSIRFALLIVSVYIVKQKTQRVQYFFAAAAPAASGVRRAKIRTKDKKGDGFSRNRLLHFAVFSLFPQNNSHRENYLLGK